MAFFTPSQSFTTVGFGMTPASPTIYIYSFTIDPENAVNMSKTVEDVMKLLSSYIFELYADLLSFIRNHHLNDRIRSCQS